MGFMVSTDATFAFTQVSNDFIRNHMPAANGNYVKIYLYLLMTSQHTGTERNLSVSSLADLMECTENDILRALRYWEKNGLLYIAWQGDDISSIQLTQTGTFAQPEPVVETAATMVPETPAPAPAVTPTVPTVSIPERQTYTPLQAEALAKDIEINKTLDTIEQLLGEPVSPAHLQLVLYFMCDIGFSSDLVITLYETAVHKGKKKPNYIEAIGINWAKQGITTRAEAHAESESFSGKYSLVSKALGINRNLAPAEKDIIDSWDSYHFSSDVIEEACKRTVLQTGGTNLHYVAGILEDWHKKNVISLPDIEKCDEAFKRQKKQQGTKPVAKKNQFQNFPQRSYSQSDYSSLEKRLLQGQKA